MQLDGTTGLKPWQPYTDTRVFNEKRRIAQGFFVTTPALMAYSGIFLFSYHSETYLSFATYLAFSRRHRKNMKGGSGCQMALMVWKAVLLSTYL